jgi:hypothetical protein
MQQVVCRVVEVDGRLVLLVLVEKNGAGGEDGGEAEGDRDDDLEPGLPGARGTA